ncbi:hypothetical protein C1752_10583 [Acaryochloris thomasi RCC1774]|uniref:Uncharacterized protein n=1 Tax=Acaryochloris thomasi RCC1774 TaxID=1764569 RepID=A0A2W1J8X8_9CYAN|nr:hypothetical protein [Acaryochloris thomasi]PZD70576.1 hypothetical protein C1752_10583 [Acaryochloris thomasi RCC1774]
MLNLFRIPEDQLFDVKPSEYIDQPKAVWRNYHNRKLFINLLLLSLVALILMFLPHQAVAQVPDSPIELLVNSGIAIQEAISDSVEEAWMEQLPLFMLILNQLAIGIAVISIIFLGLELVQEQREWGYFTWQRIVIPLVMIGLVGNVSFMSDVAFGLRNELNQLSVNAYTTLGVIDLIDEARNADALPKILSDVWAECRAADQALSGACIEDAISNSNEIIDIENRSFPGAGWVDHYRNILTEIGDNFTDGDFNPLITIPELLRDVQFALISPAIINLFTIFATGVQSAAQMLIELVLFLTAMLLPLAVARSISEGFDPLLGWFMKMLEFAMVKFFLTILIGLASIIYLDAGGVGGALWFPMLTGILSPILAFSLASGGGSSIVQSVLGAVGAVAGIAYKGFKLK